MGCMPKLIGRLTRLLEALAIDRTVVTQTIVESVALYNIRSVIGSLLLIAEQILQRIADTDRIVERTVRIDQYVIPEVFHPFAYMLTKAGAKCQDTIPISPRYSCR